MCAAGGGKTTRIVDEAFSSHERALLVTYTRNNEKEIERKIYGLGPVIPSNLEVMTWFSFLLQDLARPYRRVMHDRRIEGLQFEKGRSVPLIPESNIARHYFAGGRLVFSDKISKFICECNRRTNGAVMRRLAQRFDHIFVDEIQDMAGHDLDVIELILKAGIKLTMVGDHRQATLKTNQGKKNSAFGGINIVNKFKAWDKAGLAKLTYEQHTHRCHQHIANLGDGFFPGDPVTRSLNNMVTGHDGVYVVASTKVEAYMAAFAPQVLRFDKKTACRDLPAMNFGESKGLTFDRVMIFPHGLAKKWLISGQIDYVAKSVARMYVGVTRARHSLAFVHDGEVAVPNVQVYE
jgi:DNA helicase-2/ATP-dependent DNA helicase PcrA